MLGETLAAWVLFPAVAAAIAFGLGLLLERLTRHELGTLRLPVGLCAGVVITLAVFSVKGQAWLALAAIAVPALAGFVLARADLGGLRPSWFALGWLAAFGLHLAPVVLTGEWTWAGYNFVNDTATQLLLADHLAGHGVAAPDLAQPTTASEHVRIYLDTEYPLGSHALLATLSQLVPAPLAALYQPYIALLAATAGLGLAHLARRVGLPAAAAAAAGALAVGANLFYAYALQGNVKEIAFFMAFVAAVGAGREVLASDRPLRASVAAAICFAAAFEVYSAASAPYLAALGVLLAAAGLWQRRASIRDLALAGGALGAGALVLAIPGLSGVIRFNEVASSTFSAPGSETDLGHLLRPLELIQAAGVWLTGDYRVPVPEGRELLTGVLIALVIALLVLGVVWALLRREPGPLILFAVTGLSAAYLLGRLSPYASGKVIALASPVVVMGACVGAWALASRWKAAGVLAAAAMALGVLWSNGLAYHDVKLAPVERMEALEDAGEHVADARGLVLVNEPEEFAKFYDGGAPFNTATEAITPRQIELRTPQGFQALYFDLDLQALDYVDGFAAIVKRRSPDASRPPAGFELSYANDWYEVWRRSDNPPEVVEHMPIQALHRAAGVPDCKQVLAMAKRAEPGDRLAAAFRPDMPLLDTGRTRRSPSWAPHPWQPGMVVTQTPGATVPRAVTVQEPGRYRAWVAGSFGRRIEVRVDGRTIGEARGVNNLGQWLPAGTVELDAGRHELQLSRPGGSLAPGDGYRGELGPLVLEPLNAEPRLEEVAPARARDLCGRSWDWIELIRPQEGSRT
jgi:hypothetical protein